MSLNGHHHGTTAKRTTRDIVHQELSAEGGGGSGVQNIPPIKSH